MGPLSHNPLKPQYRMPPEWAPHEATWFSWPHNFETWPGAMMDRVRRVWVQMAEELSQGEKVHINVQDTKMEDEARTLLQGSGANLDEIYFHHFPTDDAWIRDHGPIFVFGDEEDKIFLTDWEYNAWGNKYPPFNQDNAIPRQMADALRIERVKTGMVLEGGSIEVDGHGTLMTSESCLLNPNRNPQMDKSALENHLKTHLGARHILWLKDGILGDDTDGHVDDFVRFVGGDTVVCAEEQNPQDPNYPILQEALQTLQGSRNALGNRFNLRTLPMPKPLLFKGERLPASYANFYIGNEAVLVPIFKDPKDSTALEILQELFPKRRVVGIDSRELVVGLGGIHCVTQQQPRPGS